MTVQSPTSSSNQVKVAIRVRPFNKREIDLGTKCVVAVQNAQTILQYPKEAKQLKVFSFDNCFDSIDPNGKNFVDQKQIFESLGVEVIENAFQGYNACILAYGQTGSGKSYTMMGSNAEPGLIPRLCNLIFSRIDQDSNEQTSFKVEVSYMEIYNEKVHDLLDPKNSSKRPLKVREHVLLGPMVDNLSVLAVSSFEQITQLMEEGNKCRTVASTNMNAESSRSHAVFTIHLTQTVSDMQNSFTGEKVSKISLVDLAGSERAQKSGAIGKRLEEGGNINKSLTTLGMVISSLAEKGNGKKEKFVPYRDSVLTWLLKDNLGGNSKTVMIATISPAADNFEETLSTLRYADRAKKIVNHAIVNEDPNAKIIRELKEEVEMLRMQINQNQERQNEADELRGRLAESERLIEMMNKDWNERLQETERLSRERQRDFAEIGVADVGIKMEKNRFYLVNLNADPSMNELLVYYINQHSIIGSQETITPEDKVDFRFQGLGVQPRHAVLEITNEEDKPKLYVSLLTENARVCVNGLIVEFGQKMLLRNGDRLLIGHNHFFRVNCPRDEDETLNPMNSSICSAPFDFDRAWLEANVDAGSTPNPIKAVDQYIEQIAIKHEEEKQAALEKQYEEFERYLQGLTHSLQTPSTPMTPAVTFSGLQTPSLQLPPVTFNTLNPRAQKTRFMKWAHRREELLKKSLCQLKTEIVRANALVREANLIAEELWGKRRGLLHYDVTLQIPVQNLRPSKIKAGNTVCEPVIVVKRFGMSGFQIWSMDHLENKLVDMRELYNERQIGGLEIMDSTDNTCVEESCSSSSGVLSVDEAGEFDCEKINLLIDTLFESQEKHTLIGVANIFLEVLFHDLRLDYQVPIISQQGEASGKLHIEIYRLPDDASINDEFRNSNGQSSNAFLGRVIKCRVRIKKASNLPPQLSHFVFCQYGFFNANDMLVIAPCFDGEQKAKAAPKNSFKFDHQKDHTIYVTEEFLEYVQEDALSIEVWGHRSCGFGTEQDEDKDLNKHPLTLFGTDAELVSMQKQKRLQELWTGVIRRIELWIEVKELNENGDYESVDVISGNVLTGGIYQIKQGLQRRISVRLRQSTEKGGLPLAFADVATVAIGSLCVRESNNADEEQPLDSYQEQGLEQIRAQWTKALDERQKYLSMQINSSTDPERETALIQQLMLLAEERNAVLLPASNSNIPGAQMDWTPPPGIEYNIPVMFLDVNDDDLTDVPDCDLVDTRVVGLSSVLPKERFDQMVLLPMIEKDTIEMSAICSWDSSLHNEPLLNKASTNGELIFAIVRVLVRLSYPFNTELILRKRICLNVYKKASFKDRLLRRIVDNKTANGTGVYYDVVASVPKSSLDMEDRSSLALMAARHADQSKSAFVSDQSTYVEAYTKSIQAVEWMLKLDRLRQESAVLSMLSRHEKAQRIGYGSNAQNFRIKRTISLPNTISNLTLPPAVKAQDVLPTKATDNVPIAVQNRLMDVSTSSTSSGYSSMARPSSLNLTTRFPQINSLIINNMSSPVADTSTKLSGIDEELQSDELTVPIRSSTVPETLCYNGQLDSMNGNTPLQSSSFYSCMNRLFKATSPSPGVNNNIKYD